MKQYVKTDKFGYGCDYFTEGKAYEVITFFNNRLCVRIKADNGVNTGLLLEHSCHTNSQWYFCDANGNATPIKTINICVEKTVRYNQEVQVTVDEYERLSNLNQDDLSKELTKLFDEDVAEVDDVDTKVDSYDFED